MCAFVSAPTPAPPIGSNLGQSSISTDTGNEINTWSMVEDSDTPLAEDPTYSATERAPTVPVHNTFLK